MFDSHCHLDAPAFDEDRRAVLMRARTAGVRALMIPGVHPAGWDRIAAMATSELEARAGIELRFALGVHPQALLELSEEALRGALERLPALARAQGASAIGEIGLDRRLFASPAGDAARQLALLDAQLEIADGLGLPVILHLVRAPGLLLERLEQRGPLRHGGVLHAFAGPAALIPRFARLGLSFSFAGSVARPASRRVREAAQAVPEERLLVETDAPDLSPPGAPIRNEPASLVRVVEALASLRGVPAAALAAGAEANARALFSRRSSA